MSTYTRGPLQVRIRENWPFRIETVDSDGNVVFEDIMWYISSRDKTPTDTLNGVNFDDDMRSQCIVANNRAVADNILRAAAPELLEALERILVNLPVIRDEMNAACDAARIVIAKARGVYQDTLRK